MPLDETPFANQTHLYSCPTRHYAAKKEVKDGEFPHADIFYDVSQFASYTALGYDLGRELVREMQIEDLKYFEAIK